MKEQFASMLENTALSNEQKLARALEIAAAGVEAARKEEQEKAGKAGLVAGIFGAPAASASDPIDIVRETLKDSSYTNDEKLIIVRLSGDRFKNRRRMAYAALSMLVLLFLFVIFAIWSDGRALAANTPATTYSGKIKDNIDAITWLGGFFISVIAFYFGASTIRPSS